MILSPNFFTLTLSNVLIGDLALQDEDLNVEKSFFPSNKFPAFFINFKFKLDFTCQALLISKDNGAMRLTIIYLYSLCLAANLA